jgi:fructose-specific phosphotransferase system component IIB
MYIDVAWNSVKSEKTKEEITKEIKEKILKAKLELFTADVEIEEKDMFSNADALIKLVHKHIKQAKEYLDEVY